ncbi:Conserved hypothetical protein. Putative lipase [Geotrichum candidum]|uniref:Alpha/beta hydrolase fold-3 domain-containing protein n=1 Tax=Geotrichum candidum TaxID=1173061 RepID=A0A0J9X8B2_GEOCN|nr:Conserved hypothetical protein. Putative lipase [Geotrichum candidum]
MADTRKRVIFVTVFWLLLSFIGPRHGPPGFERLNHWVSKRLSAWQLSTITLVGFYVLRNIDALLNLHPRPSNQSLYSPSFGRAVSLITAANAGFWTALPIQPKFLRDLSSLVFSGYYMLSPDNADEKSRKFNYNTSANHLRAAFELVRNPYLAFVSSLKRKTLITNLTFEIPRPRNSIYVRPVKASIWYNKPIEELKNETKMIFHIHGGGFVSTYSELHADSLTAWAIQTDLPIISIDYHLAPEYPFPYALDECFEAYVSIMRSLGLCVGLSGTVEPDVVFTGDSAGGNIATATLLKIILHNRELQESGSTERPLKKPVSIVLTYPALDLGPAGVCGKREMDLIRQQAEDDGNDTLLEKKNRIVETYFAGLKPVPMKALVKPGTVFEDHDDRPILTLSSRILFFQDAILAAPALYCMVLLYTGTDRGSTDFKNEPLMSPLWADETLLAEFPKTYITCGDIDPLVDDSVMFASRLRNARRKHVETDRDLATTDIVEIKLLTAISHGFLQFEDVWPQARAIYQDIGEWFLRSFADADALTKLTKNTRVLPAPEEFADVKLYHDPFQPGRNGFVHY